MFCPNCGNSLSDGSHSCPNCGAQLTQASTKIAEMLAAQQMAAELRAMQQRENPITIVFRMLFSFLGWCLNVALLGVRLLVRLIDDIF